MKSKLKLVPVKAPDPRKRAFEVAYHLSRPEPIQRIREKYDRTRRLDYFTALARETNAIVDMAIDVEQGSAYTVMQARKAAGYQWVPSLLMDPVQAPTFLPGPAGSIKVSAILSDYKPLKPARSFSQAEFMATVAWLDQNGFYTGNRDGFMILNKDAEDAAESDLFKPVTGPRSAEKVIFAGAIPHYGIAVNTTGHVFDAEEVSLRIVQGVDVVAEYFAMDIPNVMPTEPDPTAPAGEAIDDVVGAEDPQHLGTYFGATYNDWLAGRRYYAADGYSYSVIMFGTPPNAEFRWTLAQGTNQVLDSYR